MNLITDPRSLTDFEKLMFANGYIKELKALLSKAEQEIDKLKSEIYFISSNATTNKVIEQRKLIRQLEIKINHLNKMNDDLYLKLNEQR